MTELQKIRKDAGITQVEAAVRAGVSPNTARAYERFGGRAVPELAKRARLDAVYSGFRIHIAKHAA